MFENLMNAYARAFDPHSSYFSPRSSEEYRIQMSLNYEGIGASLQLVDDYVTIMSVTRGGPGGGRRHAQASTTASPASARARTAPSRTSSAGAWMTWCS